MNTHEKMRVLRPINKTICPTCNDTDPLYRDEMQRTLGFCVWCDEMTELTMIFKVSSNESLEYKYKQLIRVQRDAWNTANLLLIEEIEGEINRRNLP